jgi:hypothetical protein
VVGFTAGSRGEVPGKKENPCKEIIIIINGEQWIEDIEIRRQSQGGQGYGVTNCGLFSTSIDPAVFESDTKQTSGDSCVATITVTWWEANRAVSVNTWHGAAYCGSCFISQSQNRTVELCSAGLLRERRYSSYSFTTSALDGGEWSASRPGRALAPGKVPIVQETGWTPEPVCTQRIQEKSLASAGDRTSIAR